MNRSPVAIIAAVLAVATFFASNAEAGFGIRLGFGGPLPSFVAHGNGGGGGGYSSRSYRKRYVERCHKKAKTYASKRRSEPKVAKVEKKKIDRSERKVARAEKVEKVSKPKVAEKKVEKRQVIAKAHIDEPADKADSENSSITALEETTVEPVATVEPDAVETVDVKAEAPKEVNAEGQPQAKAKLEKSASKLDCKKFFPSVGMTLTVPCE